MRKSVLAVLAVGMILGMMLAIRVKAQDPVTQHGIAVSWGASIPGNSPIAGYNVWWAKCPGNVCGAFTKYNGSVVNGLALNIPPTDASTSTTYGIFVQEQDTNGGFSPPSAPMTGQTQASVLVTTPAVWPTNASAPSGCNAKIQ